MYFEKKNAWQATKVLETKVTHVFSQSVQMMPMKKETKNRANKSLVSLPQQRLTFQNLQ